ncbi:CynX/NimT family MFS transporter [Halobellus ordinarius]|uniref:MFS transporter n=1 Tax=Halobellus ordinarius TaxID=3075120 RepID=UPI0028801E1F|nr:MFS transporter [Halobellus sp. ZY16]
MTPKTPLRENALVLAGILLVALNLRPAITSVSPVLEAIRADLGLSYTAASLLTTVPTVCMGVFAFLARPISRHTSSERTVFWGLILVALATFARIGSHRPTVLFATTLLLGVGLAIIQTLLPTLVNSYFPDRAAIVTGLYSAGLIAGAAIAAGLTAPLSSLLGSWPAALATWGLLALVALAVWRPVTGGAPTRTETGNASERSVWRDPLSWYLTLYFGGNAVVYFSVLAWLPPRYVALGWSAQSAGLVLTVFTAAEFFGTLGFARLAEDRPDRRVPLGLTVVASAVGLGGVAALPLAAPWLWSIVGGLGVGGMFGLCLTLPVDYTSAGDVTAKVTSLVLGVGYLVGAGGPVAIGWLVDLLGGFALAFWALTGVCILLLVATSGLYPGREIV